MGIEPMTSWMPFRGSRQSISPRGKRARMDQTLPAPWLRARFQRSRPRNEKRSRLPMRREKGRCRAFRYRYAVDMPRRDAASLADTLRSGWPFAVCTRTSVVEALRASALRAERRAESATTSAGISFGRVRSMSSSSWAKTCNSFTRTSSDVVWTRRRSSPHRKCPRGGRRMGKVYTGYPSADGSSTLVYLQDAIRAAAQVQEELRTAVGPQRFLGLLAQR